MWIKIDFWCIIWGLEKYVRPKITLSSTTSQLHPQSVNRRNTSYVWFPWWNTQLVFILQENLNRKHFPTHLFYPNWHTKPWFTHHHVILQASSWLCTISQKVGDSLSEKVTVIRNGLGSPWMPFRYSPGSNKSGCCKVWRTMKRPSVSLLRIFGRSAMTINIVLAVWFWVCFNLHK